MTLEPGIVKTVNLDNEQMLMIESPRGDCVCVIHRGVCLIGCEPARHDRSGGPGARRWLAWARSLLIRNRTAAAAPGWKALWPLQWAST
jgi:hypothetical protein